MIWCRLPSDINIVNSGENQWIFQYRLMIPPLMIRSSTGMTPFYYSVAGSSWYNHQTVRCSLATRPWFLEKPWDLTTGFISGWEPLKNDAWPLTCPPALEKKIIKTKIRKVFFSKKFVFKFWFSISWNRKWILDFVYDPLKKPLESTWI